MIATIRETWTSVRNPDYGQEIVKKTVGQAFWYWCKYVLLISLVLTGLAIAVLTYFIPQVSRLAEKYLPDMSIAIKDGQLSTSAPQPLKYQDANFTFILDTEGKVEDADQFTSGVLILKDRIIVKDATQTRIISLAEIGTQGDLHLDKQSVVKWLQDNKFTLLLISLVTAVVGAVTLLGMYLVWYWIAFLIGGLIILIAGLVLGRGISYTDALKLTIYASVPSLLISILFALGPNQAGSFISFAIWAIFSGVWLVRLPVAKAK